MNVTPDHHRTRSAGPNEFQGREAHQIERQRSTPVAGVLDRGDDVIEKLHFQSLSGAFVAGILDRPAKPAGRLPAVLDLCGHSKGKVAGGIVSRRGPPLRRSSTDVSFLARMSPIRRKIWLMHGSSVAQATRQAPPKLITIKRSCT